MADSHPFSNAGLGMFGSAESMFAKGAMQGGSGEGGGLVGDFLASLIGLTPKDQKPKETEAKAPPTSVGPPAPVVPQYEPQTAFPDILQQQYVTPYKPGYMGNAPTTSLPGFKTSPFATQPQAPSSGYHPATDALWGNR